MYWFFSSSPQSNKVWQVRRYLSWKLLLNLLQFFLKGTGSPNVKVSQYRIILVSGLEKCKHLKQLIFVLVVPNKYCMQAPLHYNSCSSCPHCKTIKAVSRIILREVILEDIYFISHCPCPFDFYWQKTIIYFTWSINWKIVKNRWMNEVPQL